MKIDHRTLMILRGRLLFAIEESLIGKYAKGLGERVFQREKLMDEPCYTENLKWGAIEF